MHPEDNIKVPGNLQGCVSRQTTSMVVEDIINRNIKDQAALLALKQWLNYNPPPKEVEEYLWNLLVFKQR